MRLDKKHAILAKMLEFVFPAESSLLEHYIKDKNGLVARENKPVPDLTA